MSKKDDMKIVDIPVSEWCKLHSLQETNGECYKCKKEVYFTIPFESKDFVGTKTIDHGCGPQYVQIRFVPKDPDERKILDTGMNDLASKLGATKH